MSKNLTRKGLALGAVLALGSSLFAGAPAFAGTESAKITLAPNAGTTYTTLIGASYEFKNEIDQTITNSGLENKTKSELTFLVSNPSAQSINLDLDGAGQTYGNVKALTADTTDMTGNLPASGVASYTTTAKYIAITMDPASQSVDTADVAANLLKVTSSTDSTDAFSVTVQAFIDDNNDGEIGTFELTSPVRTLNFIKASAATVTTTVTSSTIGTSVLKGTIVIGNDVNNASLAGQLSIGFFKNAAAVKLVNSGSVDTVDVQWDSTNSVLTNSTYNTLAATAANGSGNTITAATYTAKAYFGVARALIGTESAAVAPVAGTVTSADHTDYLVATATTDVIQASTTATTVRSGYTGAITFTSRVLLNNNASGAVRAATHADVVNVAGVKVKVTLTKGATFTAGHEIKAGGVTLTSTSGAVSFETTTDATGKVSFTANSNKGTASDTFDVKVQVLTDSAGYETGDASAVTFSAATVATIDVPALVGNGAELSVAKGGSLSIAYDVRDNYGSPSAVAGTYRVAVTDGSPTGGADINGYATVSAGKATFSFTDNTIASTGSYTLTAQLQKLNDAGTAYDNVSGVSVATVVNVGTSAVAGLSVPADATSGIALEAEDFVNHDFRLDVNTKTYAGLGFSGGAFTVSGTATSASGAIVPGASVTISAKGLQFVAANSGSNADATVKTDTITVQTTSAGAYSVVAYSHTAGDVKIAVTSGSVSKSVLAKWSNATTADADSKLTITGAATTKSGRSTGYVIALTDAWGNAIKGAVTIKVEQAGAGYLTSTPTAVSAVDGKTNVTLITQPADAGLTTLTVTYDVAGSDTDVVAKKEILVGVSAAITKAATSRATVKNAAGLTVKVVRGTKSVTKTATSDSYKVSLKGGTGAVKVYVNGIKVASK